MSDTFNAAAPAPPYTHGNNTWLNRYYATMHVPCGYYDLARLSSLANIPPETELFALTEEQWTSRMNGLEVLSKAVIDGTWSDYVAIAPNISLQAQAEEELKWATSQAALAAAMGETFGEGMKKYVNALREICSGTDTGLTVLPARPATITA